MKQAKREDIHTLESKFFVSLQNTFYVSIYLSIYLPMYLLYSTFLFCLLCIFRPQFVDTFSSSDVHMFLLNANFSTCKLIIDWTFYKKE